MRLLDLLGDGAEQETPRNGILSSRAEWHSLGIGMAVGFVTALSGGKDAAWLFIILSSVAFGSQKSQVGQLQHVKKEPYYALTTAVMAFLLTAFVIVPRLPGGL
jgi:hypothetical protein